MNLKNPLPIYRTGWFYLLVIALAAVSFAIYEGKFSAVDQWNREVLYQLMPASARDSQIVEVSLPSSGQLQNTISEISARFPQSTQIILGSQENAMKWEQLPGSSQKDESLRVIWATHNLLSKGAAPQTRFIRNNRLLNWYEFGWRQLPEIDDKYRQDNTSIIFAPALINKDAVGVLWQEGHELRPGVVSWLIQSLSGKTQITLSQELNFSLDTSTRSWPIGFNGLIFGGGEGVNKLTLQQLLDTQKPPKVILINFGNGPSGELLSQAFARLEQGNYLTQNFQSLLLLVGLFLVGIIIARKTSARVYYQQLVVWGVFITATALVQYLLFSQLIWMPILPLLAILIPFIILLNAYDNEKNKFIQQITQQNQLLIESAKYFYEAREFEKFQPWLSRVSANEQLVERIFDLALQAESENNKTLAIKLFEWVEQTWAAHKGAAEKLAEYRQTEDSEDESELGSTLVIQPGQSSPGTISNPALQIENFGRYKVEGVLGKGAMGIVFQGVDPKINRHVAIKTLQLSGDESDENFADMKSRFFREAETAGNLSHANIVTIYDVGEEGELGYIAMDLLTGAPLSRFLKARNRLPAPLIYQLMIQITDALDYAHKQNVVHRDIKPANIIYDDEIQRVTLTDFGIACVTDQSKTRTGTIMGSPFYMSPEQVLGQRVDGRSDIFSLGVTFYQLLSGNLPFNGESIASVAFHITKSKHESVRNWDSKLPASAVRITNKALQKEPNKRYQTMFEFKQALISALKRDFKKAPIV